MKIAISLLVILATVYSSHEEQRHYEPKEEDPYRIKYLLWHDEAGHYRYENLLKEPISTRVSESDVTYYLYTRNNLEQPDLIPGNEVNYLESSNYIQGRINAFIIHGWEANYQSDFNTNIRPAILDTLDVNLFVVDWSPIADQLYASAFAAVPAVGAIVGDFIHTIMITYEQSASDFYIIGHSLGAHISGCAGAQVFTLSDSVVNSIVGLDPAGPLFTLNNIDNRLDSSDANFVHVIHTNGGELGFLSSIGDADFYPNGGSLQPGCVTGRCSHLRSFYFYAESVISSGFLSHKCTSWFSYVTGRCVNNTKSLMGEFFVDMSVSGDFYLYTNDEPPYALG